MIAFTRHNRLRKAFTQIELLVVIAIIVVLAALLFPAFGLVRKSAESAKCVSNMRQLGAALAAKIGDDAPNLLIYSFNGITERTWSSELVTKGYISREAMNKVSRCPSLATPVEQYNVYYYEVNQLDFFCYGLNRLITLTDKPDPAATPPLSRNVTINTMTLGKASSVAILGDSVTGPEQGFINPKAGKALQWLFFGIGAAGEGGHVHVRHGGRANLFFLDGHIQGLTPVEIRSLQTSNPDAYGQAPLEYAEETSKPDGKPSVKTIQ